MTVDKRVPVLAFHKVDTAFEWGVTRLTPHRFGKVIDFLKASGYQGISVQQLIDPAMPLPPKPVVLTFDDGYQNLYHYAMPVLKEAGYSATIFMISDYVGKSNQWDAHFGFKFDHLTWSELRELQSEGFEIGSHTVSHAHLPWLSRGEIHHELNESKQVLEDGLGRSVLSVSYPFGRYNEAVVRISKDCGYQKACAFFGQKKKAGKDQESFVLGRKACYIFDSTLSLKAKLKPHTMAGRLETAKLRAINFGSYGTSIVKSIHKGVKRNPGV